MKKLFYKSLFISFSIIFFSFGDQLQNSFNKSEDVKSGVRNFSVIENYNRRELSEEEFIGVNRCYFSMI